MVDLFGFLSHSIWGSTSASQHPQTPAIPSPNSDSGWSPGNVSDCCPSNSLSLVEALPLAPIGCHWLPCCHSLPRFPIGPTTLDTRVAALIKLSLRRPPWPAKARYNNSSSSFPAFTSASSALRTKAHQIPGIRCRDEVIEGSCTTMELSIFRQQHHQC